MAPNTIRKEVEFTIGTDAFSVRPTLARISAIEARFGPAPVLMRTIASQQFGVGDMAALMQMILSGVLGAPAPKDIPEAVFEHGVYSFSASVLAFLVNAISIPEADGGGDGEAGKGAAAGK